MLKELKQDLYQKQENLCFKIKDEEDKLQFRLRQALENDAEKSAEAIYSIVQAWELDFRERQRFLDKLEAKYYALTQLENGDNVKNLIYYYRMTLEDLQDELKYSEQSRRNTTASIVGLTGWENACDRLRETWIATEKLKEEIAKIESVIVFLKENEDKLK